MPTGTIADEHAVRTGSDLLADLRQVKAHDLAADPRHYDSSADGPGRANRPEQPGRIMPVIAHRGRPCATLGPDIEHDRSSRTDGVL